MFRVTQIISKHVGAHVNGAEVKRRAQGSNYSRVNMSNIKVNCNIIYEVLYSPNYRLV